MTRVCRTACLLALAALPMGCIPKVPYAPNTEILKQIGYEQGQTMLAEILTRALRPQVLNAEVTPDFFSYTVAHRQPGWYHYGIMDNRIQIYFTNVRNVDIYENDRVFVYDVAGRKISQFDFIARQDSLHFADLLMAFRDSDSAWPAPHNESPEPMDDYPEPRDNYRAPRDNYRAPRDDYRAPRRQPEESTRNLLRDDPPPPPPAARDDYDDEETTDPLLQKDRPPEPVEPYPGDDEENTRNFFDHTD